MTNNGGYDFKEYILLISTFKFNTDLRDYLKDRDIQKLIDSSFVNEAVKTWKALKKMGLKENSIEARGLNEFDKVFHSRLSFWNEFIIFILGSDYNPQRNRYDFSYIKEMMRNDLMKLTVDFFR